MASTNKTTYFELSQFIGSDHPTWLSDYNGDMLKIDTAIQGVKATAEQADSLAESTASTVSGNTSDISDLQDAVTGLVAKMGSGSLTNLGGNVSGAIGNNSIADVGANISEAINELADRIAEVAHLFTLTDTGLNSSWEVTQGGDDFQSAEQTGAVSGYMRYALNDDGTAGKIYGNININNFIGSGGRIEIKTGIEVDHPAVGYNISGIAGEFYTSDGSYYVPLTNPMLKIGTDGKITISFLASNAAKTYNSIRIDMPACMYFFKSFGD